MANRYRTYGGINESYDPRNELKYEIERKNAGKKLNKEEEKKKKLAKELVKRKNEYDKLQEQYSRDEEKLSQLKIKDKQSLIRLLNTAINNIKGEVNQDALERGLDALDNILHSLRDKEESEYKSLLTIQRNAKSLVKKNKQIVKTEKKLDNLVYGLNRSVFSQTLFEFINKAYRGNIRGAFGSIAKSMARQFDRGNLLMKTIGYTTRGIFNIADFATRGGLTWLGEKTMKLETDRSIFDRQEEDKLFYGASQLLEKIKNFDMAGLAEILADQDGIIGAVTKPLSSIPVVLGSAQAAMKTIKSEAEKAGVSKEDWLYVIRKYANVDNITEEQFLQTLKEKYRDKENSNIIKASEWNKRLALKKFLELQDSEEGYDYDDDFYADYEKSFPGFSMRRDTSKARHTANIPPEFKSDISMKDLKPSKSKADLNYAELDEVDAFNREELKECLLEFFNHINDLKDDGIKRAEKKKKDEEQKKAIASAFGKLVLGGAIVAVAGYLAYKFKEELGTFFDNIIKSGKEWWSSLWDNSDAKAQQTLNELNKEVSRIESEAGKIDTSGIKGEDFKAMPVEPVEVKSIPDAVPEKLNEVSLDSKILEGIASNDKNASMGKEEVSAFVEEVRNIANNMMEKGGDTSTVTTIDNINKLSNIGEMSETINNNSGNIKLADNNSFNAQFDNLNTGVSTNKNVYVNRNVAIDNNREAQINIVDEINKSYNYKNSFKPKQKPKPLMYELPSPVVFTSQMSGGGLDLLNS